jgi:hypothetical protein
MSGTLTVAVGNCTRVGSSETGSWCMSDPNPNGQADAFRSGDRGPPKDGSGALSRRWATATTPGCGGRIQRRRCRGEARTRVTQGAGVAAARRPDRTGLGKAVPAGALGMAEGGPDPTDFRSRKTECAGRSNDCRSRFHDCTVRKTHSARPSYK